MWWLNKAHYKFSWSVCIEDTSQDLSVNLTSISYENLYSPRPTPQQKKNNNNNNRTVNENKEKCQYNVGVNVTRVCENHVI